MNSSGNWLSDGSMGAIYMFALGGFVLFFLALITGLIAVFYRRSRRSALIGLALLIAPLGVLYLMWQIFDGSEKWGSDWIPILLIFGSWLASLVVSFVGYLRD